MSKTFTSRSSSFNTRGRGTPSRGRGRGQSTAQSEFEVARGRGQDSSRSRSNTNTRSSLSGPTTRTRSKAKSTASSTTEPSSTGKKRMYTQRTPQSQDDFRQQPPPRERPEASPQQGEYVGGFTMFQPNAKKRQQINEMAQRETAAYERFKQERKPRNMNYVGTAGGDITEETVRNRQSHDVRFQKLKRQQRQEEQRQAKKDTEQRQINAMRKDARRKVEQNELGGQTADPEDLRRRREAFLQRLENQAKD